MRRQVEAVGGVQEDVQQINPNFQDTGSISVHFKGVVRIAVYGLAGWLWMSDSCAHELLHLTFLQMTLLQFTSW
eukprot:1160420-Pelagomonas_calceolata.AAC.11